MILVLLLCLCIFATGCETERGEGAETTAPITEAQLPTVAATEAPPAPQQSAEPLYSESAPVWSADFIIDEPAH